MTAPGYIHSGADRRRVDRHSYHIGSAERQHRDRRFAQCNSVDTSLLPVGQTFEFRWVDSLGNESNVVSALVPFALLGYFSISEDITWTNTGGDSWTFSFPYSPPSNDPGDTVNNIVNFYSNREAQRWLPILRALAQRRVMLPPGSAQVPTTYLWSIPIQQAPT
ncbi:unnamed protein product [Sphagnum jensenii]|uniref:Uncharacterized protein n=1 Tax=Sphagnum jensenii TaxID=128206 RepID=A0ABP0VEX7_9BRYO